MAACCHSAAQAQVLLDNKKFPGLIPGSPCVCEGFLQVLWFAIPLKTILLDQNHTEKDTSGTFLDKVIGVKHVFDVVFVEAKHQLLETVPRQISLTKFLGLKMILYWLLSDTFS